MGARTYCNALVLLVATIAPFSASAEACPTWLPDFRCDREARFDGFVMPMSMPYLFEDPFVTSGANLVGIYHDFAKTGKFDPGYAGVLALQLRLAITDRLAFIATKDGFMMFRPDTKISTLGVGGAAGRRQLLADEDAFLNATAGFKYALIVDRENDFILTPAVRYEIPLGNDEVFQGKGDGIFIPSASMAWGIDDFHIIAGVGGQVAIDRDRDSTSIFYNLHLDYRVTDLLTPFVELNATHWTDAGDGTLKVNTAGTLGGSDLTLTQAQAALQTNGFEGADVANLGSRGVVGDELITMAWGLRVPLDDHVSLGISYERALTGEKHLFRQRVTAMATFEY